MTSFLYRSRNKLLKAFGYLALALLVGCSSYQDEASKPVRKVKHRQYGQAWNQKQDQFQKFEETNRIMDRAYDAYFEDNSSFEFDSDTELFP